MPGPSPRRAPSATDAEGGRVRADLCPGVLRPWPADDGALVRVRLAGGALTAAQLRGLGAVSAAYGDGELHLTTRANLQLRGLPLDTLPQHDDRLPEEVVAAIEATGLLPSRSHELARNLMLSPLSGVTGGRADLRPVVHALDEAIRGSEELAGLPGRFLLALDDGRGDLIDRDLDLGAVALDATTAQLRSGHGWGPVVPIGEVPGRLVELARAFVATRGTGPSAPWHVTELEGGPLHEVAPADPRVPAPAAAAAYGPVAGTSWTHHRVPDGVLGPEQRDALADRPGDALLVVTPWHGVLAGPGPEASV